VKLLALLALLGLGCQGPDAFYRGADLPKLCATLPPQVVPCANNQACWTCADANGVPLVLPPEGCQIPETVGLDLCVNDCSQCDPAK
jgi:hypothetical protein